MICSFRKNNNFIFFIFGLKKNTIINLNKSRKNNRRKLLIKMDQVQESRPNSTKYKVIMGKTFNANSIV